MNDLQQIMIINATIQLQKEFEHICFQYKIKLKKPTILIEKLSNSFGNWDANHNTIMISEDLIFKYEWPKVICVLKHEMAHQIVSQIYLSNDVHGNDFKRAAAWLGLDALYVKATLTLMEDFPDWKSAVASHEELTIFRKLEKLLNLSESSNEHEALLAMEKVAAIYKKYNMERFTHNMQMNHVSLTINLKLKKIPSHVFLISTILCEHFFVSNIFAKIYVMTDNCEYRTLVVMGEKHNVLMAEHVYGFLTHKIESLWKVYQIQKKLAGKFRTSYQKGLLEGFKTKLNDLKQNSFSSRGGYESKGSSGDVSSSNDTAPNSKEKSLIKIYETKLGEYVKTQFPKTTSFHQSGLIYKDHYDKGAAEGRLINLSRPISDRASASGTKLLHSGPSK